MEDQMMGETHNILQDGEDANMVDQIEFEEGYGQDYQRVADMSIDEKREALKNCY